MFALLCCPTESQLNRNSPQLLIKDEKTSIYKSKIPYMPKAAANAAVFGFRSFEINVKT